MYMTSFLQLLIDANWKIVPANVSHGWLEFDTVDDLETYEAQKIMVNLIFCGVMINNLIDGFLAFKNIISFSALSKIKD